MENTNSLRRVTRSQSRTPGCAIPKSVLATPASLKKATPATARKSRKALADVTNDSPVAGLTPLLATSQVGGDSTPNCAQLCQAPESCQGTPGDEVLRAYCITMLQQAGGENVKAIRPVPSLLSQFTDSPAMLAAPTPMNTPADVVWAVGGEAEANMVSPAVTAGENPVVVLIDTQNPCLEGTWSSVPLCSPKSSPAKGSCPENDSMDVFPLLVAEPVLPLNASPLLVVELSSSTHTTPRTLDFDSPEKDASHSSPKAYTGTLAASKEIADEIKSTAMAKLEEDRWSVDVNVNSPAADNLLNETTDDLSCYNQLEGDFTDSDDEVRDGDITSEINISGSRDVEELELVSTPLVMNPSFVKFRLKKEGDSQRKVDRLSTPFVWQQRESTTDGHFVEFDNEEDCDEDEWADCEEEYDEEERDVFDEVDCCDELCRGISHISMGGGSLKGLPAFTGTHTRFHYDSDGQIEEEVVKTAPVAADLSPAVTRLKGLPTPQGRHLRFESLSE